MTRSLQPKLRTTGAMNSRWWLLAGAAGLVAAGALAGGLISRQTSAEAAEARGAPTLAATAPVEAARPADKVTERTTEKSAETPAAPLACANCGVVEAVRTETRKGEGSGVGAVAGGVIGGLIGNQMGGGNGKKAMTVVGAVGGGLAGHEIEKQQRARTVYITQVRMADGSLRSFTRGSAMAIGQRVRVEGQTLRVVAG